MKHTFLSRLFLITFLLSTFFIFSPTPTQADNHCTEAGKRCDEGSSQKPCCSKGNVKYTCQGGESAGGFVQFFECKEEKKIEEKLKKEGDECSGGSTKECEGELVCRKDDKDGKVKCMKDTECAKEGAACGGDKGTKCCDTKNAKKEALVCLDNAGKTIAMKSTGINDPAGKCGYKDINQSSCIEEKQPCDKKDEQNKNKKYMCCGEMSCIKGKCMEGLPVPPSPPCAQGKFDKGKCTAVATAFGELSTDPEGFIQSLFAVLLSISGGIALLLIMKSGYLIMTAQGKPEAIQAGRDQLVAAIVGLIFLIFSFVILQTIGVDILKLPTDNAATTNTKTK